MRRSIAETRYADLEWIGSASPRYDADLERMYVGVLLLGWDGTLWDAALAAQPATTVIHEATHRYIGHVPCEDGGPEECDLTPEGAYGVGVWWLTDWLLGHPDVLPSPLCTDLENTKTGYCLVSIADSSGWAPCDRVCD